MFSKTRLLLHVNIALFVYSIIEMTKILLEHNNFFSQFLNTLFENLNSYIGQILSALTAWQNLIYLALLLVLIFMLIKFWRATFVLLEIIATFFILDYAILFFRKEIGLEHLFIVAVMVITLMNIWQTSKNLNLL